MTLQSQNATCLKLSDDGHITVELPIIDTENSIRIPETALTRDGYVWYINGKGRLQRFQTEPVFRQGKDIVVLVPVGHPKQSEFFLPPKISAAFYV